MSSAEQISHELRFDSDGPRGSKSPGGTRPGRIAQVRDHRTWVVSPQLDRRGQKVFPVPMAAHKLADDEQQGPPAFSGKCPGKSSFCHANAMIGRRSLRHRFSVKHRAQRFKEDIYFGSLEIGPLHRAECSLDVTGSIPVGAPLADGQDFGEMRGNAPLGDARANALLRSIGAGGPDQQRLPPKGGSHIRMPASWR
jgi:hypothetical protein